MPKAVGDDPYRVLGIHHGASDAEIAAAYGRWPGASTRISPARAPRSR